MNSNKELFSKSCLVFTLIRGLNLIIEEDIRMHLKSYGIGFSSFRLLWILYFGKEMTMSDLSDISQTNISNVYRQLTKLQENNLVTIKNGEDARTKEVTLTEKGETLVQSFINAKSALSDFHISSQLATIPKDDIDKFIEVGLILSSELIGPKFTDFAKKISETIEVDHHNI